MSSNVIGLTVWGFQDKWYWEGVLHGVDVTCMRIYGSPVLAGRAARRWCRTVGLAFTAGIEMRYWKEKR